VVVGVIINNNNNNNNKQEEARIVARKQREAKFTTSRRSRTIEARRQPVNVRINRANQ
jgi:hypothetical protein